MKKQFSISLEQLNTLPTDIIESVKGTLTAYDSVNIIFENGKYHDSTSVCLRAEYPKDFKVIGTVYADDIFTEVERAENYINNFHSYPIEYKGKRDYLTVRKMSDARAEGKQLKGKIINGNFTLDIEG